MVVFSCLASISGGAAFVSSGFHGIIRGRAVRTVACLTVSSRAAEVSIADERCH
jgi:hypothetical protein